MNGHASLKPQEIYLNSVLNADDAHVQEPTDARGTMNANVLTDDIFLNLKQFYLTQIPEYNQLYLEYLEDCSKSKRKRFTSMQKWTPSYRILTQLEKEMCAGPANSGHIMGTCHYINEQCREVVYRSELSTALKPFSSSVSAQILPGVTGLGSIKFFLCHSFLDKPYTLAYIDWYGDFVRDAESGIILVPKISLKKQNPFICISSILKRLVIAPHENEPDKLWILNY